MHTAADIRQYLADGETVKAIAERTGWKTTSVQAIADRATTEAPEPERPDEPPMDRARALLALVSRTIGALAKHDDASVAREVERARTTLERLEEALTVGRRRQEAEAEVIRLREELKAAEARLKEVKAGRIPGEPTPRQIRAWAAEQGIEVNPHGLIPHAVRAQYDAAHRSA